MDTLPVIAGALVVAGLVGLAIAFVRNERAQLGREARMGATGATGAAPRQLRLSIVDIGSMRYFDLRTFPHDAAGGNVAIRAIDDANARQPAAPVHVFVLPRGFERHLEALGSSGAMLYFERLRELGRGRVMKSFAYVDGWRPPAGSAIDGIARAAGVELMLELPETIGPGARPVRDMLDQALSSSS